jgi:hypothetical protein
MELAKEVGACGGWLVEVHGCAGRCKDGFEVEEVWEEVGFEFLEEGLDERS